MGNMMAKGRIEIMGDKRKPSPRNHLLCSFTCTKTYSTDLIYIHVALAGVEGKPREYLRSSPRLAQLAVTEHQMQHGTQHCLPLQIPDQEHVCYSENDTGQDLVQCTLYHVLRERSLCIGKRGDLNIEEGSRPSI